MKGFCYVLLSKILKLGIVIIIIIDVVVVIAKGSLRYKSVEFSIHGVIIVIIIIIIAIVVIVVVVVQKQRK